MRDGVTYCDHGSWSDGVCSYCDEPVDMEVKQLVIEIEDAARCAGDLTRDEIEDYQRRVRELLDERHDRAAAARTDSDATVLRLRRRP